MATPNADYSIVLRGRFPGKDRAVATAMSRVFGQNEPWGLQVVGASPITILTGMSAAQAQAVGSALIEIENVGCRFQVQQGIDNGCPTIHWASPPRINGRALDEFSGSGQHRLSAAEAHIPCPHCGKAIVIRLAPAGVPATGQTMMLSIPGPVGTIQPALAPMQVPNPMFPAAQAPVAIPVPLTPGGQKPLPAMTTNTPAKLMALTPPPAAPDLPAPVPFPSNKPPGTKTSGTLPKVPRPMAPQQIQPPAALQPAGDALEELEPLEELPALPQAPPQRMATPARPLPPLPEVPVVPSVPQPVRPMPVASMDPRMSGPMALEEFEAGLAKAQPAPAPAQVPGPAPLPAGANGDSAASLSRIIAENPDALCSVFIGKNNNPKVHALVAEIQGITTKEAQKLCIKPVVPVVKDIPVSDAEPIRRRFLEVGVTPRVTFRR